MLGYVAFEVKLVFVWFELDDVFNVWFYVVFAGLVAFEVAFNGGGLVELAVSFVV